MAGSVAITTPLFHFWIYNWEQRLGPRDCQLLALITLLHFIFENQSVLITMRPYIANLCVRIVLD